MIQDVEAEQDNQHKGHEGLKTLSSTCPCKSLWPASAVPSWPPATSPPAAGPIPCHSEVSTNRHPLIT